MAAMHVVLRQHSRFKSAYSGTRVARRFAVAQPKVREAGKNSKRDERSEMG